MLQRVAAALPVLLVVAALVFLLIRLAPGDPAALMAGDLASVEDTARLRVELNLDQPLWRQFAAWLGRVGSGDLGTSIFTRMPVSQLIAQRLEPTISIAVLTMLLVLVTAAPLGTVAAYRAGAWPDRLAMLIAVVGASTPVFLIGYLLIQALAVQVPWFPVQGYVHLFDDPAAWLHSLVLPCVNLALVYAAIMTRMTRAAVLEVLQEDYIRTARAKGLGPCGVLLHALRNAALPIVTSAGIAFTLLIGGVVVTESVFAIPGVGRLVVDSVSRRDYPVIQGVLLVSAIGLVSVNLLVDLSYRAFDPRVRH